MAKVPGDLSRVSASPNLNVQGISSAHKKKRNVVYNTQIHSESSQQ